MTRGFKFLLMMGLLAPCAHSQTIAANAGARTIIVDGDKHTTDQWMSVIRAQGARGATAALGAGTANIGGQFNFLISPSNYLDGTTTTRPGMITSDAPMLLRSQTYGAERNAVSLSVLSNMPARNFPMSGVENKIEVMGGFGSPANRYNTYRLLDGVGVHIGINAPVPVAAAIAGTYDATHFYPNTPLTAPQIALLSTGMWVRTSDATPGLAQITGWATNGASITIDAWTQPAASGVPVGGVGSVIPSGTATIGIIDNIYGLNPNIYCARVGMVQCTGTETVLFNNTGGYTHVGADPRGDLPLMDGDHSICNGAAGSYCTTGYAAYPGTSHFQYGFAALSGARAGFYWFPVGVSGVGFLSAATSGLMALAAPAGVNRWSLSYNGGQNGYSSAGINTYSLNSDNGNASLTGRLGFFNAAGTNQMIFFDGTTGTGQINGSVTLWNSAGTNQNLLLDGLTGNLAASGKVIAAKLNIGTCPTSAAGLSSGDLWCNSNVVTRVP